MRSCKPLLLALVVLALCTSHSLAARLLVPSADFLTIQAALDAARTGDIILIADGIYNEADLEFNRFSLTTQNFTIQSYSSWKGTSLDPSKVTIDATGLGSRVFIFQHFEQAGAQLAYLTITGGAVTGDGGGILCSAASPTIRNCVILGCTATFDGGAIACTNGSSPTLSDCTISGNIAGNGLLNAGNGGGLSCTGGSNPSVTRTRFIGNAASSDIGPPVMNGKGGAIYCDGSRPTIDTNTITQNSAANVGGGIACVANSAATIAHNNISENTAFNDGGGISCDASSPTITNHVALSQADPFPGAINTNTATNGRGGGIACTNGSNPKIDNNTISSNIAGGDGGGIACDDSSPRIPDLATSINTIADNVAGGNGGGIACGGALGSSPKIENATLSGNQALGGSGGGIFTSGPGSSPSSIKNNKIFNNLAAANGGGIYTEAAPPIASNLIYSNSTLNGHGGGIMCVGPSVTLVDINHNLIRDNMATFGNGGGICTDFATASIVNNTISRNACTYSGPPAGIGGVGGAVYAGNGSTVAISNCICWGDTGYDGDELGVNNYPPGQNSTLTVTYSDVQGGRSAVFVGVTCILNWGLGNIGDDPDGRDDPLFAGGDDFHLQSQGGRFDPTGPRLGLPAINPVAWVRDADQSPCIDAGDPASAFANELVPRGFAINMGAYGNTNEASKAAPLIQIFVTKAPAAVRYARAVRIEWTATGYLPGDRVTLNRVEWGQSLTTMTRVTASRFRLPLFATFTAPRIPGGFIYFRVHATVNGIGYYSNIGQIVVNPR